MKQIINILQRLWVRVRPVLSTVYAFLLRRRVPVTVVAGVLTLTMLMSVMTVSIRRVDVLDDGVQVQSYYAIRTDADTILQKTGLTLGVGDEIDVQTDGGVVTCSVTRAFPVTIHADGSAVLLQMTGGTVADALARAELTVDEDDILSADLGEAVSAGMKITLDRVKNDLVYETVSIDYKTRKEETDTLYQGETKVQESGEKGEKRNTYKVTYVNGEETERELVSSEVVKEPTDRVILVGTKVKSTFKKTSSTPASYKKVIAMTATAYVAGGTTATGRKAEWGVVSVDPKVIPLGTRVYVETADGSFIYGTAVAADTGGAIKGNKIDICVNSNSEARSFGRRTVNVYVLD